LEILLSLSGGLIIFIYGIYLMGDGLKRYAEDKIKAFLEKITSNSFFGLISGLAITSIIQSSSATTVMLVGFVNSSLMSLRQALGVILGADIGTTITGQLIAFKLTAFALPITALGGILFLFSKNQKTKYLGQAILGFGLLFHGMNIMTEPIVAFKNDEAVKHLFITFSQKPLLAALLGLFATMIFQSSSVTIGLTITLCSSELITLNSALALVMGENVGTCITAILASIGTNAGAKRTAAAHVFFKLTAATIGLSALLLFPDSIMNFVRWTSTDPARQVANWHSLFNIFLALAFLPFLGHVASLVESIIPDDKPSTKNSPIYLDSNLLEEPFAAIKASINEINRMATISKDMLQIVNEAIITNNPERLSEIEEKEELVDYLQQAVSDYLSKLIQKDLSPRDSLSITALLKAVNDVENVGDHADNLKVYAQKVFDRKINLSEDALKEIKNIGTETLDMLTDLIEALNTLSKHTAKHIIKREGKVNQMYKEYRDTHTQRLTVSNCHPDLGIIYQDLLSNYEKIGDHITNIAERILNNQI
jgi:phosphate:Na+ symporter